MSNRKVEHLQLVVQVLQRLHGARRDEDELRLGQRAAALPRFEQNGSASVAGASDRSRTHLHVWKDKSQ